MSNLVVMKFGGTSVASPERIQMTSQKAAKAKKSGKKVVVVVSAPGQMTDELIDLAHKVTQKPDPREMDMLMVTGEQMSIALFAMALHTHGVKASSLTGPQAGILANDNHTTAKILSIKPQRIWKTLKENKVAVVAGFQGVNTKGEITTLGRGGSDLTAVALAAVLKAQACEIYTDVEGVFTADPRMVPKARKIHKITYDEMLELASGGAQVMQPRAIEVAKRFNVPIHVKCSFNDEEGTWIMKSTTKTEQTVVSGIAADHHLSKITIAGVPDKPGVASKVFEEMSEDGIPVDMIVQSAAKNGTNDISITVSRANSKSASKAMERACKKLGAQKVVTDEGCAKVSIVGVGLKSESAVPAKIFKTLAEKKINIHMISTSDITIACVVDEPQAGDAVRALHDTFELSRKF